MTWDRPSWPLGANKLNLNFTFAADLDLNAHRPQPKAIPKELKDALQEFDLTFPATWDEVKKIYKKLVKNHHPDKHGGAKEAEDKLKKINQAYATLKKFFK
ncbi:DnaJ domain-containing protein [Candidatus Bealeia paramacronuclearis]|uniref:DnaJ domain-containing protein n=1 Tax=Candidatus Bealeia paramacronuclearis TaxID=1921001 RepID=A0ABZ2C4T3_9PROT|nr:DnaJ domain-containing protein [Candidatus Bealeia paramacronuclearis]